MTQKTLDTCGLWSSMADWMNQLFFFLPLGAARAPSIPQPSGIWSSFLVSTRINSPGRNPLVAAMSVATKKSPVMAK